MAGPQVNRRTVLVFSALVAPMVAALGTVRAAEPAATPGEQLGPYLEDARAGGVRSAKHLSAASDLYFW